MTTQPIARSTISRAGRSNSGRLPSYSDVATQLGIALCGGGSGCAWSGQLTRPSVAAHRRGVTTGRVIHWSNRRVTRRGLRRFLLLAAPMNTGERFVALYQQSIAADRLAKIVGVRFPRAFADGDRAKVRLWLARFRNSPLDREFREQRELMRRIQRWSRP